LVGALRREVISLQATSCWHKKLRWRPTSVARWPWPTTLPRKRTDECSTTELAIDFIAPAVRTRGDVGAQNQQSKRFCPPTRAHAASVRQSPNAGLARAAHDAPNRSIWSHKPTAENFRERGATQWRGCKTRTAVYSIAAVSSATLECHQVVQPDLWQPRRVRFE
jgi:hypothetical protein